VFDLRASGLKYETAANLAVYPENREADVLKFAETFNLNLKKRFMWQKNKDFTQNKQVNTPFPISNKGITVKEALTTFIDIQGPISKRLLKDFMPHCRS
jgi:sulfite reductase alpha subunit-like flavoprotein